MRQRHYSSALIVFTFVIAILSACGGTADTRGEGLAEPAGGDVGEAPPSENTAQTGSSDGDAAAELLIWAPPFFTVSDQEDDPLRRAHLLFRDRTGIEIKITPKAESGRSSLLAYLRTASHAAPVVLPDILMLSNGDLRQAIDEGLLIPAGSQSFEFLPAAQTAVNREGISFGIPYALDLEHLVYPEAAMERTPANLDELLDQGARYLFTANSNEGFSTNYLLLLYGAQEADSGTEPYSRERLRKLLTFLARANESGLTDPDAYSFIGFDSVWARYADGDGDLVNLPSSFVSAERRRIEGLGFAPLPTFGGEPLVAARVWSFVILADTESRQTLSLSYIDQILDPETHTAWAAQNGFLPSRLQTPDEWGADNPYLEFLASLSDRIYVLPNDTEIGETARRLHVAQRELAQVETEVEATIEALLESSP